MSQCESCTAPTDLYICERCVEELRTNLLALVECRVTVPDDHNKPGDWRTPGLLANLNDVVLRQTKTGNNNGHRKRGDEMAALYEPDTEKSRPSKQGEASRLLDVARNTLSTIVRDICETRGIDYPATTSAAAAQWLAEHVHTMACDDAAGLWKREIDGLVHKIEKAIDRPPAPRFCGPCTHYVEHNRHCGRLLYARPVYDRQSGDWREAIEITCSACRTTHNIEHLTHNLENRVDVMRFTSAEILTIMTMLGKPIPERSWSRWRNDLRVKVRGYKRPDNPDGTRGALRLNRLSADDEPVYRLAEVRRVYATSIKHTDAEKLADV